MRFDPTIERLKKRNISKLKVLEKKRKEDEKVLKQQLKEDARNAKLIFEQFKKLINPIQSAINVFKSMPEEYHFNEDRIRKMLFDSNLKTDETTSLIRYFQNLEEVVFNFNIWKRDRFCLDKIIWPKKIN